MNRVDQIYYAMKNLSQVVDMDKILGYKGNRKFWRFFKEFVGGKLSLFSYKNLPDGLLPFDIELALMFSNACCLYKSEGLGKIILGRYTSVSNGIYNRPETINVDTISGRRITTEPINFEDVILVKDNEMDIIPFLSISDYIYILMQIDQTLLNNVQLLRLPTLFKCGKSQTASVNKIFEAIDDFKPFVVTDKNSSVSIEATKLEMPYDCTDIYDLEEKYRQQAMGSIGIYGADKKRERLITAEIESTNDWVDMVYEEMLRCRQDFVKEANKRWGLNIELVESYVTNRQQETDLKAEEAEKVTEGEAKGESKGGGDNGKPKNDNV